MTGLALIFVLLFSPKVHRDMFLSLQNETNCTANQKTLDSVYLNIIKYTCTYIQQLNVKTAMVITLKDGRKSLSISSKNIWPQK